MSQATSASPIDPPTAWPLAVTPFGHLRIIADGAEDSPGSSTKKIATAFESGTGAGLLELLRVPGKALNDPALRYWRAFAARFVGQACALSREVDHGRFKPPPPPAEEDLQRIAANLPPMPGAEYVEVALLHTFWQELGTAFTAALRASGEPLGTFVRSIGEEWNLLGRVHFNLAENRRDEEAPFAFMATWTGALNDRGGERHQPLSTALKEFAGKAENERLLALLLPMKRAAAHCPWLADMIADGSIYHPLRWTPAEALRMLRDAELLEKAGVVLRMPAQWRGATPPRPKVEAVVGGNPPSQLGLDALLDFNMRVSLEGEELTADEVETLLAATEGLVLLRGQWTMVDHERLQRTLQRFETVEAMARKEGLGFHEAVRLLNGVGLAAGPGTEGDMAGHGLVTAGPWLAEALHGLRSPESLAALDPGKALKGTLRPYQAVGLRWMHLLTGLRLGACLADDMGLGKTIQVLSLLLVRKAGKQNKGPSILVAPASLLANWEAEAARFAPGLKCIVAHRSAAGGQVESFADVRGHDLVITSYGTLMRAPWMQEAAWDLAIIDEAQAIKNPGTKQTKSVKMLKGNARIALTGTPIENRLGDLWSIFDFINPGLLGNASLFSDYAKKLAKNAQADYAPLRELVRPYILRRMKSDKRIIADLPDKTEVKAWCMLTRKQTALYQGSVEELAKRLQEAEGIERRGLVLSFLMRFKQICNHPSQWLGEQSWAESESGKWQRLRAIAEVVAEKQEKLLLFTQFKEITAPLEAFLADVFGRPGLVLHGGTPVKKRGEMVRAFQEDERLPFFVLSLKAGGSGLNLTAASHVVHFDRWWNPAVEDQATDRAFRIGQKRNVLVHKFICKGTLEERIDALIDSKQRLSRELLQGGDEVDITSMGNDELLDLLKLDIGAAMEQ